MLMCGGWMWRRSVENVTAAVSLRMSVYVASIVCPVLPVWLCGAHRVGRISRWTQHTAAISEDSASAPAILIRLLIMQLIVMCNPPGAGVRRWSHLLLFHIRLTWSLLDVEWRSVECCMRGRQAVFSTDDGSN